MRSELLFRDFAVADSPGLDTFDPRLGDVMVAVQNSDFAQAADLAEALLNENECDIRLAGYLLFDDYASMAQAHSLKCSRLLIISSKIIGMHLVCRTKKSKPSRRLIGWSIRSPSCLIKR